MNYRNLLIALTMISCMISIAKAQNSIDKYLRSEHDYYILYAPNETEMNKGEEKLMYAAKKFSSYFNSPPPKISVLLTANPSNLQKMDLTEVKAESNHFLPFITESFLDNESQNTTNVFALNMGAVLLERNAQIKVVAVIGQANDLGLDIQGSDIITAINGEKISTLQEFKKIYNAINVSDPISLQINRNGSDHKVSFAKHLGDKLPTINAFQANSPKAPTSAIQNRSHTARRPLTHEACHGFFMAYVDMEFPDLPKPTKGYKYGSEKMPDWLDEAAATLCEVPEFQNERSKFLLQNLENRYSLGEIFSMAHPLETLIETNRKQKTGPQVLRLESGEHITLKLGMFYSQVQSIANFFIAKTQPKIMEEITRHYASNRGGITTFLQKRADLPNTLDAFEQEWLTWVKKNG